MEIDDRGGGGGGGDDDKFDMMKELYMGLIIEWLDHAYIGNIEQVSCEWLSKFIATNVNQYVTREDIIRILESRPFLPYEDNKSFLK